MARLRKTPLSVYFVPLLLKHPSWTSHNTLFLLPGVSLVSLSDSGSRVMLTELQVCASRQ